MACSKDAAAPPTLRERKVGMDLLRLDSTLLQLKDFIALLGASLLLIKKRFATQPKVVSSVQSRVGSECPWSGIAG